MTDEGMFASSEPAAERAAQYFATAQWTAGIIGLGYVGLPLAATAVEAGLRCIGFDVSPDVVRRLGRGESHVGDVSDEQLRAALDNGLEVTTSEERLRDADALLLCVPSPLGRNRQPDMSYIEAVATALMRESLVAAVSAMPLKPQSPRTPMRLRSTSGSRPS